MKPHLSAPSIVQLLSQYYPAGLWCDDPEYKTSVEAQRLTALLEEARKDSQAWDGFVQRIHEELPGCVLWDTTLLWIDPCYRLRVCLPSTARGGEQRDAIICMVSLLAPTYVIYASHYLDTGASTESWTRYPPLPPEFQPYDARLAPIIESAFGASRLLNDVLFTPVPNLAPRTGNVALGKACLIDLLFTPDRW
ncbi:MAG TPA: hypothetical protein VNA24_07200 [Hyalangium sp.]|jgi:hypothetical protein|nr:hypothetical protein [Hyalangium sp.]